MKKVIKPPKLVKGDTVGIVSPSSPVKSRIEFEKGIKNLNHLGLKTKIGEHVFDKYYYNAGTREDRISDFNAMCEDPNVNMLLMSTGGSSCMQLLDGIDYKMIKRQPKIFTGLSDSTIIINAIFAKTNLVTYHGIDLCHNFGFINEMTPIMKDNIVKTLFNGSVGALKPNPNWKHYLDTSYQYKGWKWLRLGIAKGQLIGGHTNSFTQLLHTGYSPDFKGKILFLEGTSSLYNLDRIFSSLRLCGVFNNITGIIIGIFNGYSLNDKNQTREVGEVILEMTKNLSFPILEIGELGHYVENYLLPIGCKATINSYQNTFRIEEETVI